MAAKVAASHGGRQRLGMVIELKPECYEAYTDAHADSHHGVRDLLVRYGLVNFSIFHQEVHGKHLLFLYCEYVGADYAADMARLSAEPRDVAWHVLMDPMQTSLRAEGGGWTPMKHVFYNA